ncbi:ATP-dependent helicase [uncultured Bifidobacterium sp.]|uniref:ATP-dependent helicase n=1 Tax=uncultured Bifidobacterium sp. TaxID=165187 RepID=UPI0025826C63|nr:ATP-dependent helicase [uncultured Bifidobacterium sp.]
MLEGDNKVKLTLTQQQIVNTSGNLIVQASAGTGKTATMVAKIAAEIENNHTHKVVAAITFTIKAAQEIKERITIDTSRHFIGTNNRFAIEEIIKPFLKDVYGDEFDVDMDTDYRIRVDSFSEGLNKIKQDKVLCSYRDSKKNFVFDLAFDVITKSSACRLYLQAKYFKIYIDEYQDCDKSMHKLFMYICNNLHIDTFVIGDEKQSIYIWRGAYPEAFKSLGEKPNFKKILMRDNFRSCQQIQNYSNLLCEETRGLYTPIKNLDHIILITPKTQDWPSEVLQYINPQKRTALLRFKNDDAECGASELNNAGSNFAFIPHPPIADITTETAWLYTAIAKYVILPEYSVYDLISEIPAEMNIGGKSITVIKSKLESIKQVESREQFDTAVRSLCDYFGYKTHSKHLDKLLSTISNKKYHTAFNTDKYQNIALTFHSSKGLEFDQVILFARDYDLSTMNGIYNHYVAATRAKDKLVIVKSFDYCSNRFEDNLTKIFALSGLSMHDLVICK